MIKLLNGADAQRHPQLFDAMYRGRAQVFGERLGWDVTVVEGRERDRYDDENPLYLVATDPMTGEAAGSLRLMPTTGPTMLKDVFVDIFEEPVDLASATIWEATRFCVNPDAPARLTPTRLHLATCELSLGMCEVALRAGLTQIIGVFDRRMIRIYQRIGWEPDVIASSDAFPHGTIFVGLWDVSEEALASMRLRSGIAHSVIDDGEPRHPVGIAA